jgi:hypothetical protein
MSRICIWCSVILFAFAAFVAAEQVPSATILATATVVQPVGLRLADSAAVVIRFVDREVRLDSEAFRVHRRQGLRGRLYVSPTVCVAVQAENQDRIITLIPTAD